MNTENMIEYIQKNLNRPIVLTGMMGTGKSQLGRKLADTLNLNFYDSDSCVEEKAGCSVAEIFERFGEQKFRRAEKNTILELLEKGPCIIATGGGAVMTEGTQEALLSRSHSIWVKSTLDDIMLRVSKNQNRPLLQNDDPQQVLKDVLKARQETYARAPIHIDNPNNQLQITLENLINRLCDHIKASNNASDE